jgi:hypothetical protein
MKTQEQIGKQSDAIYAMFLDWLRYNGHIITERDVERMYDDMLDDMLDEYPVTIGSLEYSGSYVLQQVDPVAYRCGFLDFVDGQFYRLYDYGLASDDYAQSLESLWDDFEDEMLAICDICGKLCPASDAVAIDPEDGYSDRACPDCRDS